MPVLVGNLAEFLSLLVQSFNLSAFFPAFVFVLLNYLYVRPLLADLGRQLTFPEIAEPLQATVGVVIVVSLAYILNAANSLLIRLLEGYPIRGQYPYNQWEQENKQEVQNLKNEISDLKSAIEQLDKYKKRFPRLQRGPYDRLQRTLISRKQALLTRQLYFYPTSEGRALPTPIGNIIAAAEEYPKLTFGMDAVALWPYLAPTLTGSGYAKFVERERAIFDWLLNNLVLLAVFGVELGFVGAMTPGLTRELGLQLFIIGLGVWLFYTLLIQGALNWGFTIRAAFILHRQQFRAALGLANPGSYKKEFELWVTISEFYRNPARAWETGQKPDLFTYEVAVPTPDQPPEQPDEPEA